ncbi:MAG: hypoxanthine phosphoribosyltransferase [Chlamydiota bacterium]
METRDKLEVVISEEEILKKISSVAKQLDHDYAGQEIVIVIVMKGAICLVADLIRHLSSPCSLEFVRGSSYGARGVERGDLIITGLEAMNVTGKNVLVVDDIFDSGTTLTEIVNQFKKLQPITLKSLVLLSKKVERTVNYTPDYVLFEIENRFVVGYGLDYKEHYRGLPGIYTMANL